MDLTNLNNLPGFSSGLNFNFSALIAGLIFSTIGIFIYKSGRKNAHIPDVIIGITLIIYTYFLDNDYLIWGIGVLLIFISKRLRN